MKLYYYFKRVTDLFIAVILSVVLLFPMIVVAICIKLDSKGPVLFVQKRTGLNGKPFNLYKFRSMAKTNDVYDKTSADKITKVGKFIRRTSLDELPQIINILKGDMSFIGPRPWIVDYYNNFTEEQKQRVNVLPGITGLAQVCGRNTISVFDKIALDLKYVKNYSIIGDMKVIYWTIKTIHGGSGVDIGKGGIQYELEQLKNQHKKTVKKENISEVELKKTARTKKIRRTQNTQTKRKPAKQLV